jgi:hypothetical protein
LAASVRGPPAIWSSSVPGRPSTPPSASPAQREHQRAARGHERLAGPLQRLAHRLGGGEVCRYCPQEVAGEQRVVLESEVDHAVGFLGGGAQAVEVVEVAAPDLGAEAVDRCSRLAGAGEPEHLVASREQLGDDG